MRAGLYIIYSTPSQTPYLIIIYAKREQRGLAAAAAALSRKETITTNSFIIYSRSLLARARLHIHIHKAKQTSSSRVFEFFASETYIRTYYTCTHTLGNFVKKKKRKEKENGGKMHEARRARSQGADVHARLSPSLNTRRPP